MPVSSEAALTEDLHNFGRNQVPDGNTVVASYLSFNQDRESVEVTVFYRPDGGGDKRRIDLEFRLTGVGDVLATEAVPFD